MRVFLAFSFRDEDRDLVNIVERLLASHGCRLVSGQNLAGQAGISQQIKQRLTEADALLALFTRRDPGPDGAWTTHSWVRDEYLYVRSLDKPAFALVEEGVAVGGMMAGAEFIGLDRGQLLPAVLALSEVLGRWKEELAQRRPGARRRASGGQPGKKVKREAGPDTPKKPQGVPKVFVNYRRENAQGRAGRLADTLRLYLGEQNVFFDQDDIPPGVDFVAESLSAIARSRLVLAVIGKEWALAKDDAGGTRLASPSDLVRRELAAALEHDLPIVPVLIDGATMPREDQLPTELQALARRNAVEVRDTRWTYDVRYVAQRLGEQLGVQPRFAREG